MKIFPWDAIVGFLHIFANFQEKLATDDAQPMGLLNEVLDLQQDMVVMLLSMLEGNIVNGTIGRMLLDTFCEAQSDVEMIMRFFTTFLKLKTLIECDKMRELDPEDHGSLHRKEFLTLLEQTSVYAADEVEFLLKCMKYDEFGKINYKQFCEGYHKPAMDIGFELTVLLVNLKEHMSGEPRLQRFMKMADSMIEYFKPYLGRIEIIGQAKRIERIYFEIKESSLEQWEKPQVRDSKKEFIFDVVNNEGGDQGKMEAFIDFCENSIFEMQLSSAISSNKFNIEEDENEEEEVEEKEVEAQRGFFGSVGHAVKHAFSTLASVFTLKFMKKTYKFIKRMTVKDMLMFVIWIGVFVPLTIISKCFTLFVFNFYGVFSFIINGRLMEELKKTTWTEILMELPEPCQDGIQGYADPDLEDEEHILRKKTENSQAALQETEEQEVLDEEQAAAKAQKEQLQHDREMIDVCVWKPSLTGFGDMSLEEAAEALGLHEEDEEEYASITSRRASQCDDTEMAQIRDADAVHRLAQILGLKHQKKNEKLILVAENPPQWRWYRRKRERPAKYEPQIEDEKSTIVEIASRVSEFINCCLCLAARNYYSIKLFALFLVVMINFILLTFKYELLEDDEKEHPDDWEPEEILDHPELLWVFDIEAVLWWLANLHSIMSVILVIGFYNLKVPLTIFKREKDVCRNMEFQGVYIEENPSEDDITGQWDRLVISCQSFPRCYWDKFIKKKVFEKYSVQNDPQKLHKILGTEKVGHNQPDNDCGKTEMGFRETIFSWVKSIDYQYTIWKMGVVLMDSNFLYLIGYLILSILGHYNYFFYAGNLIDIAMGFKTLRTILSSVTHNGKQLILTMLLLTVVVYIHTVIAFNFFKEFYEGDDENDVQCNDMLTCFLFHLYKGVRAGGGIGDEIGDPTAFL